MAAILPVAAFRPLLEVDFRPRDLGAFVLLGFPRVPFLCVLFATHCLKPNRCVKQQGSTKKLCPF